MEKIPDQDQRDRALDVTQSFIVQAPAGSGKTELLTNRFVNLLKTVKNPEEIIAITFTRKAAAEMRHRILSKVPEIDAQRLRIMTIDALCGFLSAQMPLKSKLAEGFTIVENAEDYYKKAIESLFLNHREKFLEDFLLYLDNDMTRVNNLCIEILRSRDQWLPHIFQFAQHDEFVQVLGNVLILLVAELQIIFNEQEKYDFTEVALRALEALGDEENPTDLALKLDYQIKHLLVDEFQDTSITQWRLLKKITMGWEPFDGRTLFLVGDPMQSIYRFRKAEVGLFLEVQKHGINNISLISLTLTTNFRSDKNLIYWFNENFPKIFKGDITYVPSQAIKNYKTNQAVTYDKPDKIIDIIRAHPTEKIAILVRSRTHVKDIIPLLQEHNIAFRAVEMANLSEHPLVEDLFSLTRALINPVDRIAWLSILRAPWCGLSLNELHDLCAKNHDATVWELLSTSSLATPRILHAKKALQTAMDNRGRLSLREWVEKTWLHLKGDYCLSSENDFRIAYKYFDLLDIYQDVETIKKQLVSLSVPTDKTSHANVEVMTIHKAKGLEFDVVILPGLERYTRPDSSKLFLWEERLNAQGDMELIVGPLGTSTYDELKKIEQQKDEEELQRLLYVAVTRSKKYLYLLYALYTKNPTKRSFLNLLWPCMPDHVLQSGKIERQKRVLKKDYFWRLPESIL